MKKFTYLLLVILFAMPVFAKKVDVETAKNAAKNLYYLRIYNLQDYKLSDINLDLIHTETVNNEPIYYIFNVNNNEGFVIISADDIVSPCIGYGFEGGYNIINQAPALKFFMNSYKNNINDVMVKKVAASDEVNKEWQSLLTKDPIITKSKSIQPLLLTKWNQDWPYNELCPVDLEGPGDHVYVGCVATSMIQIMRYYSYPKTGAGSHTNYSSYGNLTVNYASQTYNWDNMPLSINGSNLEIAKIGYHAGVSVNMNYAPDGSGAQSYVVPEALESHFKYNTACQYVQQQSYSSSQWISLLKGQIDLKRPMIYVGYSSDGSGHAWNCDGYNTSNEFHMNWGWSGTSNGYFNVYLPMQAGGIEFNNNFSAIIDIYPASGYPEGCGTKTITGEAGAFNDGSGNQNYSNNLNCSYLIQPPCASVVNVIFDRFNLETGDVVTLYNGSTISSPVIGTFTSTNTPGATTYAAYNGAMLIKFTSDGTNNAEGWYASYTTFPCQGSRTITDLSGDVVDGSLNCNYDNSITCNWYIQPTGTSSSTIFHLTFPEFNFAAGDAGDYLKIYKNTVSTNTVVGTYNAVTPPPSKLDINGTKVILKFQSNTSSNGAGWKVSYTTTLTGIENNLAEFGASIYPNPFNNDATIAYTLNDPTNVKISVTNILGKQIGSYEQQNAHGKFNLQLSSFVNNISQGIYFVNLSFNDKSTAIKIVCTK